MFGLGGTTYSEIRSVYEVAQAKNKEIIIGTTNILTPDSFINVLKNLRSLVGVRFDPEYGYADVVDPNGPAIKPQEEKKGKKKILGMFKKEK